jgi:hypothetical protein
MKLSAKELSLLIAAHARDLIRLDENMDGVGFSPEAWKTIKRIVDRMNQILEESKNE